MRISHQYKFLTVALAASLALLSTTTESRAAMGTSLGLALPPASVAQVPGNNTVGSCSDATKAVLSGYGTASARDELCEMLGDAALRAKAVDSPEAYRAILETASNLRTAGYGSPSLFPSMMIVSIFRPPTDMEILGSAYASSHGCVTPALVAADMAGTIARAMNTHEREASADRFRDFSGEDFAQYIAGVGNAAGCIASGYLMLRPK